MHVFEWRFESFSIFFALRQFNSEMFFFSCWFFRCTLFFFWFCWSFALQSFSIYSLFARTLTYVWSVHQLNYITLESHVHVWAVAHSRSPSKRAAHTHAKMCNLKQKLKHVKNPLSLPLCVDILAKKSNGKKYNKQYVYVNVWQSVSEGEQNTKIVWK